MKNRYLVITFLLVFCAAGVASAAYCQFENEMINTNSLNQVEDNNFSGHGKLKKNNFNGHGKLKKENRTPGKINVTVIFSTFEHGQNDVQAQSQYRPLEIDVFKNFFPGAFWNNQSFDNSTMTYKPASIYAVCQGAFQNDLKAASVFGGGTAGRAECPPCPPDRTCGDSNVPIPGAIWLFGCGLLSILGFGKRKSMKK
ncbi:MAG: hypothetical protein GY874_06780 [Desulfobacteraceae bacterium]|nr:hypothetical protein [Desulfobacteraceae bacterium]